MYQLGIVKNIVEEAGMGISYAYEDLVFLEHNIFLLQFTDSEREVLIHVNREADNAEANVLISRLRRSSQQHEMQFFYGMEYILSEEDDENITIEFIDS